MLTPTTRQTFTSTSASTSVPPQTPWQGELDLIFTYQENQTKLTHAKTIAPYRVQRAFQNPDGSCQVVMLHTAGGMVSGDRLTATINIGDRAAALLTTATAGKIYRSTVCLNQARSNKIVSWGSHSRRALFPTVI